jgi:ubiquinone/menaquinone biosynthesis C-methylase UbiE
VLQKAFEWVLQGYVKFAAAYFVCVGVAFAFIWLLLEPTGVPEMVVVSENGEIKRIYLHIFLALILGCHICLGALLLAIYSDDGILKPPADRVYSPANSQAFYNAIAHSYDSRNSASLHATHQKVIDLLSKSKRKKKYINVLDLGGGTGKLIAHHFLNEDSIHWSYVDNSASMMEQFVKNMDGCKLSYDTTLIDVDKFVEKKYINDLFLENYDIVLISLALTSLPRNPDWGKISRFLKIGGSLIIADIDASYTSKYPYYTVKASNGKHALRPRAVTMSSLLNEISGEHLDFDHTYPIRQGQTDYAFVLEFTKS